MDKNPQGITPTWDSKALGLDTYRLIHVSKDVMNRVGKTQGHFTAKVSISDDESKKILGANGFYYCDTLIEPYCLREEFIYFENGSASISGDVNGEDLVSLSRGAFYGRFHRDRNIGKDTADLRYDLWVRELCEAGKILALIFEGELAGYFGYSENRINISAIGERFRNKGLAKYLWSAACSRLFKDHMELISSLSVHNLPIRKLHDSLGFRYRNELEVYHRFNKG